MLYGESKSAGSCGHFKFHTKRECAGLTGGDRGWKFCPTKAVAGRSGPSLAGDAATRGPKRRQGSSGVRVSSLESVKLVEAELVPVNEGSMCAVDKRDGVAPPVSLAKTRSRQLNPRKCPIGGADHGWNRGTPTTNHEARPPT